MKYPTEQQIRVWLEMVRGNAAGKWLMAGSYGIPAESLNYLEELFVLALKGMQR